MWKRIAILAGLAVLAMLMWNLSPKAGGDMMTGNKAMDSMFVAQTLSSWPEQSRALKDELTAKYGEPDEFTPTVAIWHNNGPWKKTVLMKDGFAHNWPSNHTDFLMQEIGYKVPVDKFDDVAQFDGSVVAARTKGTLGAMCGSEKMNFLAINLANDVITGTKTVDEVRSHYEMVAMKVMNGETDPYVERLQFAVASGNTGDPDQASDGQPGASVEPGTGME